MLRRPDVAPFLHERPGQDAAEVEGERPGERPGGYEGELEVEFLTDADGRVLRFLERLLRLVKRLEGRSRATVREALRRQERRVRDVRRLSGLSRTLLSLSRFEPLAGADRALEVRDTLFRARGERWPPVPGDAEHPYRAAAEALGLDPAEVRRLLYADDPDALVLVRAPRLSAQALLRRYNLDLARAVLLDAAEVRLEAEGGWRGIFAAVKLARLMYRLEPVDPDGRARYRLVLTGPAAPFVTRARRYGARFARVVPALTRAPGWSLEASVIHGDRTLLYRLEREPAVARGRGRPQRYDSTWERDLAEEFREKIGDERGGWTLHREDTPVALGEELFLPDFTMRHQDGRVALVELVGFWTPEYLEEKLRKVRLAGLEHLVLVVFRGLAASQGDDPARFENLPGALVWFRERVRIGPVMEAVERVASEPGTRPPPGG
jgi:uncharacterized protein